MNHRCRDQRTLYGTAVVESKQFILLERVLLAGISAKVEYDWLRRVIMLLVCRHSTDCLSWTEVDSLVIENALLTSYDLL